MPVDAQVRPRQRRVPPVEHVVFFPAADGTPGFRRLPSLEEAVRLVEHLRNVEEVDSVSVHALSEVPLQFRAYYRVEVPTDHAAAGPAAVEEAVHVAPEVPAQAGEPVLEPAPVPMVDVEHEPVPSLALVEDLPAVAPELAHSNGHGKDGGASLGFFA